MIKALIRLKDDLFYHVYNSKIYFKIVDNVTQGIFATVVFGHVSEPSWIWEPILKSKLTR